MAAETENQIVVYRPNETIRLDIRLENETVWLTQERMCELFQRERSVITKHIRKVFSEGECDEKNNVQILHINQRWWSIALCVLRGAVAGYVFTCGDADRKGEEGYPSDRQLGMPLNAGHACKEAQWRESGGRFAAARQQACAKRY